MADAARDRAATRGGDAVLLLVSALAFGGCYHGLDGANEGAGSGASGDGGSGAESGTGGDVPENAEVVPPSGMRRLTIDEYDNTLADLLFDDSRNSELLLPKDVRTPFDNDSTEQIASQALIEGAHLLAADAAERLLADPVKRDMVVGCIPTGPADTECFEQFVTSFGRRALRRPLTEAEIADYMGFLEYGSETSDFYTAVDTAVRAFLQDPEFLYRIELGEPVADAPGVFRLTQWEVGTRLSYFLWGSTPPDWLLDRAEAGELGHGDGIRSAASDLLADPRAKSRIDRFHALWLGYENLPHSAELSDAMRAETAALLQRVVFDDDLPYDDLFTMTQTRIDDVLAQHYDLPSPGATPQWVDYGDSGRAGILSHGSFLSVAGKFGDSSPTQRGILIRTRLFCEVIPPPPPNVNPDDDIPPSADAFCKTDRYEIHRQGGCAGCHDQMDPIGFGLERYDQMGRYREYEVDDPDTEPDESTCEIPGQGEIVGIGTFSGPAELGQLMVDSGRVEMCVVTQLYRFAMGRYELDDNDLALVGLLVENAGTPGFHFADLLLELVSNDGFRFRREEQP